MSMRLEAACKSYEGQLNAAQFEGFAGHQQGFTGPTGIRISFWFSALKHAPS
jgi:hypothetical protein